MIGVHADLERKAQADMAGGRGIPDAQSGYREYLVREPQNFADRLGMVANDADRTAAETGGFGRKDKGLQHQGRVDRGVEEPFELPVSRVVPARFADALEPAGIAAEHQELRRSTDPWHVGDEMRQLVALRAILDPNDAGLLEVRFGRGR